MLTITVPRRTFFNDDTGEFIYVNETTLQLEHSLLSLKKWEAKWRVPFLGDNEKTVEQTLDYIRCMTITQNVNPLVYNCLTNENIEEINKYIDAPMTATWFGDDDVNKRKTGKKTDVVTAERIYYWMVMYHIPFECQKWHLNQLVTLIRVCNEENNPKKPLKGKALRNRNRELNEARKKMLHTRG